MKKFLLVCVLLITALTVLSSCTKAPAYGENIIKNGQFELGSDTEGGGRNISDWTIGRSDDSGYTGKIGAKLVDNHGYVISMVHDKAEYSYFYQKVAIKKNSYYHLHVQIHTAAYEGDDSTGTSTIQSGVGTNVGAFIGFLEDDSFIYQKQLTTNGKWVDVDIYFYTKGYSELTIALRLGTQGNTVKATSKAEVWFDNASLIRVKESTLGDLGATASSIKTLSKGKNNPLYNGFAIFITVIFCVISVAACVLLYRFVRKGLKDKDLGADLNFKKLSATHLLIIILGAAFIVRMLVQQFIGGYAETTGPDYFSSLFPQITDLGEWKNFFGTAVGRSQTPGMLYLYSIFGAISNIPFLNIEFGSPAIDFLSKIPGIAADLLAAGYIFIFAKRFKGEKTAFLFGLIYALLPAVFTASAGWGTADSILGLFLVLAFFALLDKKYILVAVYTTLALIFNVKALYVLPLITVYLGYIFYRDTESRAKLAITAVACAIGFWIISFPFTDFSDNPFSIFVHYTTLSKVTLSGIIPPIIDRTTLDAFNFYAMVGGNNQLYTSLQAGLDIVIAIALFVGVIALFFKKKNRADLILLSAFTITAIFMFTLGMQPFSMIFALILLLTYVIVANEKRVFFIFSAFSFMTLLNMVLVLGSDGVIGESLLSAKTGTLTGYYSLLGPAWVIILSVVNVLLTVYFAYVVYDITYKGNLKSILPFGDNSGDGLIMEKIKGWLPSKR
ncbi:MAG: hypothetical protein LBQ27_00930 [Clostridiales bacterium]|jgi:hypothetical protein|nr:hypothetical protein [Clostridiales bacterium]